MGRLLVLLLLPTSVQDAASTLAVGLLRSALLDLGQRFPPSLIRRYDRKAIPSRQALGTPEYPSAVLISAPELTE